MRLGIFNLNTRKATQERFLTSWISQDNPSSGAFTLGLDSNNTKQILVMRREVPYRRSGVWDGESFTFFSKFKDTYNVSFLYFPNENEYYFSWNNGIGYNSFIRLSDKGEVFLHTLGKDQISTRLLAISRDIYINLQSDLSKGCVTTELSTCRGNYPFMWVSGSIEEWHYHFNSSMGPSDCKEMCRRNCSCHAYTNAFPDGTGCGLSTAQTYIFYPNGEAFYFRENLVIGKAAPAPKKHSWRWKMHLALAITASLLLTVICNLLEKINCHGDAERQDLGEKLDDQLPFFSLSSIIIATDQFSESNKLGEGGFGPVYKGKLLSGQEIAVKRLSTISGHGIEQFKNEVMLISKLQHRNLVRLLGYCAQGEEKLLVYEYLPNKSLDSILFDPTKRASLDWKARGNIIDGIAQGLLYLRKYSRLKVNHRDLKTSNVLLDAEMQPKISDFGTATIFQVNGTRANRRRIMGTYGYMSPEDATDGLFSEKSDVFSFGVMVLAIISGNKNTGFYDPSRVLNLLAYAWDLWTEGRVTDLADPMLSEDFSISSCLRYIQVGLLCVQENARDRPTMLGVVSMFLNEMISLPVPKQPAFSTIVTMNNISENPTPCCANKLTISDMEGRYIVLSNYDI